jgi:hypothetical protein
MSMDELHYHVSRKLDVRCRPEDDGRYLLYNPRTDELHLLGPVEKQVYDLCDGRSIDGVVEEATPLLEGLGIREPEAVAREVLAFLRALSRRGLVEYR